MGWTWTWDKRHDETATDYLKRSGVVSWSLPPEQMPVVVASTATRSCVVFAVRIPDAYVQSDRGKSLLDAYVPDLDGSITIADVIAIKHDARATDGCTFGYKDMSEGMIPYETCPPSFLKHLSAARPDTDGGRNVEQWRASCRAAAATVSAKRKISDGATVTLPAPVRFSDGNEYQTFTATRVNVGRWRARKKLVFRAPDGQLCNITAAQLEGAEIAA